MLSQAVAIRSARKRDMADNRSIRDRVAIVGIGETTYYKRGQSPMSEFEMAVESIARAADDAGLPMSEIDGFASYSMDGTDPVRLANVLGVNDLRFSNMFWGGGGGGVCGAVGNAAAAIVAGLADTVVVFRSLAQGQVRYGAGAGVMATGPYVDGSMAHMIPYGLMTPAQSIALKTSRFMYEHRLSTDVLAAIALNSYEHAQHNPRAVMYGRPLTREQYDASRWIVEPFHLFDCCLENDGAAALIVTSADRATDRKERPVYLMSAAQGSVRGHNLKHSRDNYATANFTTVARRLYETAGVGPSDIDVAQIYENFTGGALMSLVEHGFCAAEEAEEFVTPENLLWRSGKLPLNTSGGNLAECYMHGLELVIEAVRQLRGTSTCQVEGAEISLVAGGPVTAPVSSLILRR
jgi:acetyl-CoA acetyltransferase